MSGQGTVLVTGGSGFIGGWCVIGLLQQGYAVRTTVRSLARESASSRRDRQGGGSRGIASASMPPTSPRTPAGTRPRPAATTSSTSPRRVAIDGAEERRRSHHSRPRRHPARHRRRPQGRREARGADLLGGGDQRRAAAHARAQRRDGLDRSRRPRGQRLCPLQDPGRARRLGPGRRLGWHHDARHRQSRRWCSDRCSAATSPTPSSSWSACCPAGCPACRGWASTSSMCATWPTCTSAP